MGRASRCSTSGSEAEAHGGTKRSSTWGGQRLGTKRAAQPPQYHFPGQQSDPVMQGSLHFPAGVGN
jgi:hypothetical protein